MYLNSANEMSSLVIKVSSLVIKTVSKPIAVSLALLQSKTSKPSTNGGCRTESKLKPENMSAFVAFA